MIRYFSYIKVIFLSIAICFFKLGSGQEAEGILSKTIIFKVKEVHREVCSESSVDIEGLDVVLSEIGGDRLEKVFPNKLEETDKDKIDLSLIYQLTYANSNSVFEVVVRINELEIMEYVEPYYLPRLAYTPSDSNLSRQYYIDLINAKNAWDVTTGDTNIVIGITDTGWDPTHPDLLGNVKINYADPVDGTDDDGDGYVDNYLGWDLGMNDNNALWESLSHGINVTGIAAANTDNVTGISGVGFNTKFLPIKISNHAGFLTEAYQGIVYAADHDCFIINCSWGDYNFSQFEKDIIDYAVINKGCIVVAAVGNDDSENTFYPAGYNGVFSVAATDQNDLKLWNSNYGNYVDISAPGGDMYTTGPNGYYSTNSGTSMATPVVSGAAALVKAQFPAYTNTQIVDLLKATADNIKTLNPGFESKLGSGRLNLFNAVTNVLEKDVMDNTVQLYPNPSKGIVTIKSDRIIRQVIIRNVLGEKVRETNSMSLDISNQPSGIYFVEVVAENSRVIKKFILSK